MQTTCTSIGKDGRSTPMSEPDRRWPAGEGDLAERIRRYDWAATPLGAIGEWPASLKALVELMLASPQAVLIAWGPDKRLLYNECYALTILGDKHPEALGAPFAAVWPDLMDELAPLFSGIAAGEAQKFEDYRVELPHRPEAPVGWFCFSWAPARDDQGQVSGLYCTAFETTDKVLAAEALQESEERSRLLVESWAQAIWEVPAHGRVVYDNPSWRQSTGQSFDELIGDGWVDAVHPDDRDYAAAAWRCALERRQPLDAEFRLRRAGGGWQWTNVRAAPLLDARGKVRKWVGMNVDITARREAEAALGERIARDNLIVDAVPAMIGYVDHETRYVWLNAEFERYFRVPRTSLIGKSLREALPPEAYVSRHPHLHAVLRGERVRFEGCVHDQFGPGRHGWTEESYIPDIGGDGKVRGFFVLAIDISARRHAEAELRLSEERYRLAIGAFQGGVSGYDPTTGQIWGTEGLFRLFGAPVQNTPLVLDDFLVRVHPDDQAPVRATLEQVVEDGRGPRDLEYRARHSDGRWRVLWTRLMALSRGPRGHPLLAATIDITEKSEWQARLATESERLRLALDVGQLATWDWDMLAGSVSWNDHHFRLQGYRPGQMEPSYDAWAKRVHPDDYPDLVRAIDSARDGHEEFEAVYRVRLPDHEIRWCSSRGRFFYDAVGRAVRMIGVTIDITDERAAREAAAESERRLRTLMSAIPQLVFRAHSDGAMLWASPQWCAYTGLSADESLGRGWLAAIHPEDQAATRDAWAAAAGTGRYAVEHRIRHAATGEWRWHQTQAMPVDSDGDGGADPDWVGTSTDIDEVRRLQRRQQTLLAELQHRVRNSLGIIRSIMQRTAETSDSIEAMTAHLNGRIGAFARVQSAVTRDPAGGVDLAGLIEDELLAYATREGPRLHIRGPRVLLGPRAAESMSLAIHELTTNAVKHGVLSEQDGWIDIDWRIEGDRFHFSWKEAGRLADLSPPKSSGFGLELLLRSLPYDLGATTEVTFEPGGLRFTLVARADAIRHVTALSG